ncbi:MAG: hypothetical protein WDA16_06515 [Candidatus Thermoplasmatota archaeon]
MMFLCILLLSIMTTARRLLPLALLTIAFTSSLVTPSAAAMSPFKCGSTYTIVVGDDGMGIAMSVTYIHMVSVPASLRSFDIVAVDSSGMTETTHYPGPGGELAFTNWHAAHETEFQLYSHLSHMKIDLTLKNCAWG